MQCAVCAAPAESLTPVDFDGVIVRCTHCGDYEVSGTVSDKFLRLGLHERAVALEKAKALATTGTRPAITMDCL